ncbi:GNAT family N-acetyltransferase [Anaerobiospirillum sp. NML120449]|uniref:GNAT family N-acetyltransferase n=1 Tax=Anaerobiospirillum sp. NML120449 TaxID=2932817 RepID=UPI001FF26805|nr:GNAT family N-acetyltransferase [Anaerobiospirillum sp. NML120449]MCK0526493.1 GNAT family N-acetyltransferase [Anaerobiospirillum sp. NML120449]
MNQKYARQIMRRQEPEKFGDYTFVTGKVKYLKEVQSLHSQLFRVPMLNWLVWLYRFRSPELVSLVLDKENKVVGYECFMLNEGEIEHHILHSLYVGVHPSLQGQGIATALRRWSIASYDFGNLNALSTVADMNDIRALRSAQKAGYGIEKQALKPPGHYLVRHLTIAR